MIHSKKYTDAAKLEELRSDVQDILSDPDGDCDTEAFGRRILWAINEIESLRKRVEQLEAAK